MTFERQPVPELELPKLISLDELAARSGESRRTINRRVEAGVISVRRLSSRCTRVSQEEAIKYLTRQSVSGNRA